MTELLESSDSTGIQNTAMAQAERRREPRVQSARPVYVQPAEPDGEQFEEVRVMRDFSSWGLYFTTDSDFYSKGMQLHVIPGIGCLNLEYDSEVLRIERLPSGEYGVAVRLLRVRNLMVSAHTATQMAYQSFVRVDCS